MRLDRFVLVIERDGESQSSDAEGVPVIEPMSSTRVRGSLSMLSAREAFRAQHFGEHIEAAAGVPNGTAVDHRDRVVLDEALNPCAPSQLVGSWTVEAVRHTRPRLRLLLRRSAHP